MVLFLQVSHSIGFYWLVGFSFFTGFWFFAKCIFARIDAYSYAST